MLLRYAGILRIVLNGICNHIKHFAKKALRIFFTICHDLTAIHVTQLRINGNNNFAFANQVNLSFVLFENGCNRFTGLFQGEY